ncbi:MAG TPA: histidine kinase dimerization/phosphoacceptor domain-containing protein [Gaiellaceae bacterium]
MDDRRLDDLLLDVGELRAASARLVAAADGERRRIEHDLHDGVQQRLVALGVALQLARRAADDGDRSALKKLLEEIACDLREALADVRRLASRVYPPFLHERGVVEALRAAAAEAAVPTRVEAAGPVERYPADVEATAYFCCVRALETTAAAAGARATIRVRREPRALVFEVIVEGGAREPWAEQDLLAVGDRLTAAGGRLAVSSEAGESACLSGTIPLPA